jgi:hypothetical protein
MTKWEAGESPGVGEEWISLHIVPEVRLVSELSIRVSIWLWGIEFLWCKVLDLDGINQS